MTPLQDRHDAAIDAAVAPFLPWVEDNAGGQVVATSAVAPGLGHRSFHRLRLEGAAVDTVILRIDPPGSRPTIPGVPPEPPLEPIREALEQAGLPVPRSFGFDERRGLDLLEDVGDDSLEHCAESKTSADRIRLYREAVALIPRLQAVDVHSTTVVNFARRLDAALIESKAHKVKTWLLPATFGRSPSATESAVVDEAFAEIAQAVVNAPARLAHRDFKAANLHVRRDPTRLVMIDLQGAFLAPPEYDLVCLLRDSHVRLPEDEVREHMTFVRPTLPDDPEPDVFDERFDLITLVRVAKDVSHYLHAFDERGDARYLSYVEDGLEVIREAAHRQGRRSNTMARFESLVHDLPLPPHCLGRRRPEAACVQ